MGQRASFAVDKFQRTFDDKEDFGVLGYDQRVHRAWRFLNDIAPTRNPIVFEVSPRAL